MQLHKSKPTLMRLKVKPPSNKDDDSRPVARTSEGREPVTGPGPSPLHLKRPTILVLTRDASLRQLISDVCPSPWAVESQSEPGPSRDLTLERNVRMVVIDDEVVSAPERGWLCNQINKLAPEAAMIYIASQHSAEVEKTARAHGALYYTSKPLDSGRLSKLLQAWLKRPSP